MRKTGLVVSLSIGLLLTVAAGVIFWQRYAIYDTVRAQSYQPSAAMRSLVDRAGMNATGERLFYAQHPEMSGTQKFNSQCGEFEKADVVLGCYNGVKIYLFDVASDELDGVEDVTAAHEMLHAAYDRLGVFDKPRVERLLEAEATKLAADTEFKTRMSVYDNLGRDGRLNELHSVVGTEVASLSPELETYYARYFSQRSKTVALFKKYSDVFVSLRTETETLARELDALAATINTRTAAYNTASTQLTEDIALFNTKVDGMGHTVTEAQYKAINAEHAALNSRIATLEAERSEVLALHTQYEEKHARYEKIALHMTELNNSMNSKLAPSPTPVI